MGRQPAVVQSAPEDPLYLLDPKNQREDPYLYDKFAMIGGVIGGAMMPLYNNYSKRRPLYAGIHITIASAVLGGVIGWWYQDYSNKYFAERDAIYHHYIKMHPEDFPAKERILIADMLKPWAPIR